MKYVLSFLVITTALCAAPAFAQNARPVWSQDYTVNAAAAEPPAPSVVRTEPRYYPPARPVPRPRMATNNADAAWARQWGPVQDVTGISSGTAKNFLQGVKQNYVAGSAQTLSSAQDWAVILGQSGLMSAVADTSADWFKYATVDFPSAVFTGPGSGGSYFGGWGGLSSYSWFGGQE